MINRPRTKKRYVACERQYSMPARRATLVMGRLDDSFDHPCLRVLPSTRMTFTAGLRRSRTTLLGADRTKRAAGPDGLPALLRFLSARRYAGSHTRRPVRCSPSVAPRPGWTGRRAGGFLARLRR